MRGLEGSLFGCNAELLGFPCPAFNTFCAASHALNKEDRTKIEHKPLAQTNLVFEQRSLTPLPSGFWVVPSRPWDVLQDRNDQRSKHSLPHS